MGQWRVFGSYSTPTPCICKQNTYFVERFGSANGNYNYVSGLGGISGRRRRAPIMSCSHVVALFGKNEAIQVDKSKASDYLASTRA